MAQEHKTTMTCAMLAPPCASRLGRPSITGSLMAASDFAALSHLRLQISDLR